MPKKNDWALVHRHVLEPSGRAPTVPDDTKRTPLEMWVKGHLMQDAEIGDAVTVKTRTGRLETGNLVEINPTHRHDFGKFIPELLEIEDRLKAFLFGEGDEQ